MRATSRIISFSGTRGAGKDTAANFLATRLIDEGYSVKRFSFAQALYGEISRAFGVDLDVLQNRSTKELPQMYLTLSRCKDSNFRPVALEHISKWRLLEHKPRITSESALSPREILKCWGTQYRRDSANGSQTYWVDQVKALMNETPGVDFWVCSDCRLDNEHDLLKSMDALMVRINASHLKEDDDEICKIGHESDTQWRKWNYDRVITNEWGCPEILGEYVAEIHRDLIDQASSQWNYLV